MRLQLIKLIFFTAKQINDEILGLAIHEKGRVTIYTILYLKGLREKFIFHGNWPNDLQFINSLRATVKIIFHGKITCLSIY